MTLRNTTHLMLFGGQMAGVVALVTLAMGGCADREPPRQPLVADKADTPAANEQQPAATELTTVAGAENSAEKTPTEHRVAKPPAESKPPKEPLFAGWPKPKLVFIFSGQQQGYLEPCGCAGLENQKGGLSRRHTFLKSLVAKGWTVVPLDVGGMIRRFGRESELQYQITIDSLKGMDYRALTFGFEDLRQPTDILTLASAGLLDSKTRLVSANVALKDVGEELLPRYYVFDAGGLKIGVTGILGDRFRKQLFNEDVKTTDPATALAEVVPKLQEQKCDLLVLLSHAAIDHGRTTQPGETIDLAKKFPAFQFVVTAGGATEPPLTPEVIKGTSSQLVEVGHKGEYVTAIGLFDDPKMPLRFQRVPLDDRFDDSPEMHQLKVALQDQIRQLGFEGLGITPASYPERQPPANLPKAAEQRDRKFVGTKTCAECHTKATAIFEKTPHAHATESIVHLDPPRHFDPECLSCHVTGWEPQRFVPFPTGFESLEKTPLLVANGCENCHGPGDAHAAAEAGDLLVTDQQKTALREQMRLPLAKAHDVCIKCHDQDNSPEYQKKGFEVFWPKIEHKGKD